MADARDLRERIVRVAAAALGGAFTLFAGAAHAQVSGSADVSLGGGSSAGTSGEAPVAAEEKSPTEDAPKAEEPVDPRVKNPANYEFAFVSVAAYQTWSIAGSVLYFGAGGGIGPPLYRVGKIGHNKFGWDPDLEIATANIFLRVKPVQYVDIDIGPKMGLGSTLFNAKDAPQSSFSYGGYVDLRFGSPTIKLGPRFEYDRVAHSDYFENGWRLTPIMLRVVH
jgi:hypothetical protein